MTINPNRLITCLFLAACLFLKGLIISHIVMAANEVSRINAIESQGQTSVVLFLKDRPAYSLKAVDERHILLTLHDTLKGAAFEKNIPEGNLIAINEGQNPVALKFDIGLQRPFLKVDSSWVEDKKLLYIDISALEEPVAQAKSAQGITALQDIRFGFIEKGTRMVMRMDNYPSWEIEFPSPSKLLMHLIDVSDALKKEKYGAVKRLKEINILKTSDKRTDISLGLESSLNHVSLFRMTTGDRLVLDILDEPGVIPEEALASKREIPGAAILKEENQTAKSGTDNMGNLVRMKINKNEESNDNSSTEKIPISETKTDSSVKLEPKFNDTLPMSSEMKKTIDGLSPEEAFLYGRIKQAMEIKDYEKGIVLTNQFLNELPNSVLVEDILFLRGDFYYSLWKNGDNEVSGNVTSSYQKAIDRFPESELVPLSYIKMAQAESLKEGGEYMALGYLGLVLSQKKNSDLMPLAYLTRGKIFLRINKSEKALADFKLILEQYKGSAYTVEANFWIASYYHSVGLYEDAEKKLQEVLDLNPDIYVEHPEYLFLRAKNCLYLKDYDLAREYLFKAVNIGRQQEGADMLLTRIGDTYHSQENEKEAEKYYRMVVDYYPATEGASIAKLRLANYSSDSSILDELGSGKVNESISELALLEKGYQLFDKNQYSNVIDTIKQLIDKPVQTETRKGARSLFYNAAEKEMTRLYQEGKYKDLTDCYTSIKTLLADNINPDTMLSVALAYNKLHLNEQAISAFQRIKLNNLNLQSRGGYYLGLAESYLNNGDSSASRSLLEKAENYDLAPADKQRIARSLAMLYIEDDMLNDAYLLCQSIITGEKCLPDDEIVDVYILTAKILNMQKRYGEAETTLNSTPGMPDKITGNSLKSAYMELGKACFNMGEYPNAIKSYEGAFNLGYGTDNKDYWDVRFNLAQAYINAGEEKKAKTLLSEISEGGDAVLQQRAQLKLGSMDLETQLQRLPLGKDLGD